ncbi:enoyl-CoA hydratase [Oceanicola sp. 22II-s10i]|uniref:enoyl-CoA hydratase/isomerase family protein n=1 Tax=Oceanicola sp. 22II-s10i TaxID=1317116 RepID=UPI000B5244BC|nr:enoyl-CoA hydratase-related protein [Oceanicola sp. 22II-s10i]OWU85855.1 enoyl-CoA hydratase [Oceanicola sp. 22II-s10i]
MIIETRSGGVVTLLMNDPEKRNAFSIPMRLALLDKFRELESDPDVRVIVFSGAGGVFCVGGDVTSMGHKPIGEALDRMRIVHDLVRLLAQSSKPKIAAVEGWAVGGGLALALLCDTIVAAETARFKAGYGGIGMAPDVGILHTLPARVGRGRARQIFLYDEAFNAGQALDWGIVDSIVPEGGTLEEAQRLAAILANKAPLPIALTRSVLSSGLDDVLMREREIQALMFSSEDHAEGRAAFFEKRAAKFTGN